MMNITSIYDTFDRNTPHIVTVGTFDGVHLGHQRMISRLMESSSELNGKPIVVTFDPHPQIVLNKPGRDPVRLLSTLSERLQLLNVYGINDVVVIPFSAEFAELTPDFFIRELLMKNVGISRFVIGYDHVFGKNREGNEEIIRAIGEEKGFDVEKLPAYQIGGATVSSTKIRHALIDKNIDAANTMLGYPYFIQGVVSRGDGRGRRLGVPTANIQPDDRDKLLPGNGVYLVSSEIRGKLVYGMANVGVRPTFTDDLEPSLEVHYLNFSDMVYDLPVKVWFLKFIRHERKFESADLFLSQLNDDRYYCYDLIEKLENKSSAPPATLY